MTEEAHSPEGDLLSASNVTAILMRIAGSALQASGHEEASRLLRRWPEIIGTKIGKPFNRIQEKKIKGEKVTQQDTQDLEKALNENPKEAATLLGLLIAEATEGTVDAAAERAMILDSYGLVLNTICALMIKAKTSLVLRGFIHDPNCISYWEYHEGMNSGFRFSEDSLHPSGLEIYLSAKEPTPEILCQYNEAIRRDPRRQLRSTKPDYRKDPKVALVERISELSVTLRQIDPKKSKAPDPFNLNEGLAFPGDFEHDIPFGAPALVGLFESIFEARKYQGAPLHELDVTRSVIAGTLRKAS